MGLALLALVQCLLLFFRYWSPQNELFVIKSISEFLDDASSAWFTTLLPLLLLSLISLSRALQHYFQKHARYADYYRFHGPIIQLLLVIIWFIAGVSMMLFIRILTKPTPHATSNYWIIWVLGLVAEFAMLWISIWSNEMPMHRSFHILAGCTLALGIVAILMDAVWLSTLPLAFFFTWEAWHTWRARAQILLPATMVLFVLAIIAGNFDFGQGLTMMLGACLFLVAHEANERLKSEASSPPSLPNLSTRRNHIAF